MKKEAINPENMAAPRGYSHAVAVSGAHKNIFVGGQNAIDENGELVGKGDLKAQTGQALANIEKIMAKAGGKFGDVVKLNIQLVQGQNPQAGFQAFQEKFGDMEVLPAITVLFATGLGNPDWLVEIDAIAVLSE
jgi:enamine deaminase RidA (YjgF/YER057c/UK114 family)